MISNVMRVDTDGVPKIVQEYFVYGPKRVFVVLLFNGDKIYVSIDTVRRESSKVFNFPWNENYDAIALDVYMNKHIQKYLV